MFHKGCLNHHIRPKSIPESRPVSHNMLSFYELREDFVRKLTHFHYIIETIAKVVMVPRCHEVNKHFLSNVDMQKPITFSFSSNESQNEENWLYEVISPMLNYPTLSWSCFKIYHEFFISCFFFDVLFRNALYKNTQSTNTRRKIFP